MKDLEKILTSAKNKEFLPIYFFHGEEPYFMEIALKTIEEEALEEEERIFNQNVLYGKDITYSDVLSLARQYPVLGKRLLIVVKEAQDLKIDEKSSSLFQNYVANPVESTVLIFLHKHKKVDTRRKVFKDLEKKKMLFLSEQIRDYKIPAWIRTECKRMKINISDDIPALLGEYLGNDLSRIDNELTKVKLVLKQDQVFDGQALEKHIGISKDFNVFELQRALGNKNAASAFKIGHYMAKNAKSHPLVLTIGTLFTFFSNLVLFHSLRGQSPQKIAAAMGINPFFLKEYDEFSRFYPLKQTTKIISFLRETDMKSKGFGSRNIDEKELMQELIYKILNADRI